MKLYGKNPVLERLKTEPRSIRKIYLQEAHPDAGYVLKKAKQWGIPVYQVPRTKLQKMARSLNTQGLLADIGDFPYTDYDDLLSEAPKKKMSLLFLDGMTDPQNFGGIIRSLACLGGFGIILPRHNSVDVTETVLRIACGGENYVKISKVANLNQAIRKAREAGFWIMGAAVEGGEDLRAVKFSFPLGLVIGSEQKGIRPVIGKELDKEVSLPMAQPRLSLNAAHAATLFCYEIVRQKYDGVTTSPRHPSPESRE